MLFYNNKIDEDKYVIATYFIKSKNADLATCAWNLAIGQSVGNPNVRNQWESEELFEQSSCVIVHDKKELQTLTQGEVKIAFPIIKTALCPDFFRTSLRDNQLHPLRKSFDRA